MGHGRLGEEITNVIRAGPEIIDRRLAYHEACHAVVANRLNVPVTEISLIYDKKTGYDAHVKYDWGKEVECFEDLSRKELLQFGIIASAGIVAEEGNYSYGASFDEEDIEGVVGVLELRKVDCVKKGWINCARLIIKSERKAIDKLTKLMKEKVVINGEEFVAFINSERSTL